MKRFLFLVISFGLLVVQLFGQAIPREISYQGVLNDAAGYTAADGVYSITFRLYSESNGGTALWSEQQDVTVEKGLFSVYLGSVNSLSAVPFDRVCFLGMTIGAGSELLPRTKLTPAPYALMAMNVTDNMVVKSVNNLKDNVNLVAGTNVTITPSGSNLTIATTTDLKVQGEIQTDKTGDANLVPIAYANVNSDGTVNTAATTSNVTLGSHTSGSGHYYFNITNESIYDTNYVCIATLINSPGEIRWSSSDGQLYIGTYDSAGTSSDRAFSFVLYKK